MLLNPGFELDFASWDDWGNSAITTSTVYSGTKALQVGTAAGGRAQRIETLVVGSTYTMCAWSKLDSLSDGAWMGVNIHDSGSALVANHQWTVSWTDYTQQSVTFTVPPAYDFANIWIWKDPGSTHVYADEFVLAEGNTCSSPVSPGPSNANYPFPQHASYAPGTIKPDHRTQTQLDDDVRAFYDYWKASYVVSAGANGSGDPMYRVTFGSGNPGSTVSEGQGFGMTIVATMAGHDPQARDIFDGLWSFFKEHPSVGDARLMDWQVPESSGDNSAFDGDADIAFGLLLADAQWGSAGAVDYAGEAADLIAGILASEIGPASRLPMLGDWVNPSGAPHNQYSPRSSDFMFVNFRAFGRATGDPVWETVVANSQAVIDSIQASHSPVTGLLPDFIVNAGTSPQPAPAGFLEGANDPNYNYNAGRDPWRLGTDALLNNDPDSFAQAGKMVSWIAAASGGNPANIEAGYTLGGTPLAYYFSTFFAAPFGVAAMTDPAHQAFLNDIYDAVYGTHEDYYADSVNLLALLVMTGNFWDPTNPPALPADIEIMSWVPPYAIGPSQAAAQADFGACDAADGLTRVGLQFWVPNSDGTIKYADHEWYTPTDADVGWWTGWCDANGIDCLLTVYNNTGSWDWNLARAAFAANRATFVAGLVAEMDRLGLDGIDIDLEGIGSFESDRVDFDQFIHDLWLELEARGKVLTVDSFHYIWNAPNQAWWGDWLGEVDNIHSMGYADLYEGGSGYQKYSFQQDTGLAAGFPADGVLMGMPGWLSTWGLSSGRGASALAHVQEVRYDLPAPTGIAIWDLQLTGWQDSDLWCELKGLKDTGLRGPGPVNDLEASLLGNDLHLAWPAVTQNQVGNPLLIDHYEVHRSMRPYFEPGPATYLGSTPALAYIDVGAAGNAAQQYYYSVVAVTATGWAGDSSNRVGEFDFALTK